MNKIILLLFLLLAIPVVAAENILIIVVHPDDEVIGMGGVMIQAATRGDNIDVVMVTDGVRGNDSYKTQQRYNDSIRVLEFLGFSENNFHTVGLEDGGEIVELTPEIMAQHIHELQVLIDSLQPDIIYTQAYESGSIDHDMVNYMVSRAVRLSDESYVVYEASEYTRFFADYERYGYSWDRCGVLPANVTAIDESLFPANNLEMTAVELNMERNIIGMYHNWLPFDANSEDSWCNPPQPPYENVSMFWSNMYFRGPDTLRLMPDNDYSMGPCRVYSEGNLVGTCSYEVPDEETGVDWSLFYEKTVAIDELLFVSNEDSHVQFEGTIASEEELITYFNEIISENVPVYTVYGSNSAPSDITTAFQLGVYLGSHGLNPSLTHVASDEEIISEDYAENIIVVLGGPCANQEAHNLIYEYQNQSQGANCYEHFAENTFKLWTFEHQGKTHIMIAGFYAEDTLAAGNFIANLG